MFELCPRAQLSHPHLDNARTLLKEGINPSESKLLLPSAQTHTTSSNDLLTCSHSNTLKS